MPPSLDSLLRATNVTAADGTVLRVHHSDVDPERPVLVFLHGFGEGSYVWMDTIEFFGSACSVVAPDLRGHGDSNWSACGEYNCELDVSDLAHILSYLKVEQAILVGHSLGGTIAARFASAHPDMIVALALLDMGIDAGSRAIKNIAEGLRECLRGYRTPSEYRDWLIKNRPLMAPRTADRLSQVALRKTDDHFQLKVDPVLAARLETPDISIADERNSVLRMISCPVLVVRGAGSAVLDGPSANAVVAALSDATLVTIPRAGHDLIGDNPVALNHLLGEFVSTHIPDPQAWML